MNTSRQMSLTTADNSAIDVSTQAPEVTWAPWQPNTSQPAWDAMFTQPFDVLYIRWIYITLFGLIFISCVIGNAIVIFVILKHRKMRNVTNFFLANLAASDLCVGLFCVLPNLSTFLSPYWLLGRAMCKLYYFIQCTSYTASILILTVISLERYFAIIHPMLNKRFTRMCLLRIVVSIIWLCAALYGLPYLMIYDTYRVTGANNQSAEFCIITGDWRINMEAYSITNFIVLYAMPLLLITVMYIRISMVLWKSGRNMGVNVGIHYTSRALMNTGRHSTPKSSCHSCGKDSTNKDHNSSCTKESTNATDKHTNVTSHSSVQNGTMNPLTREMSMEVPRRKPNWLLRLMARPNQWARSADEQDRIMPPTACTGIVRPAETKDNKRKVNLTVNKNKSSQRSLNNPFITRRKVIRLLIGIIVCFALCVLPHHVRVLWQYWSPNSVSFSFSHMLIPPSTFLFFYANSALNPFLYALLSDHFRRAFSELLPKWCRWRQTRTQRDAASRDSRLTIEKRSSTSERPQNASLRSTGLTNGIYSTTL